MAEYQLLRCAVALAGDREQVVVRGRHDPILFPELIVLQYIHGEDAITDVHVVGTCEMALDEAWTRMITLYGEEPVKQVFPGARPTVPRMDRTVPLCSQPIYVPEPTRPDSPDPRLRPLDRIAVPVRTAQRRPAPPQTPESDPTPDEIAAHAQDDEADVISDQELSDMGLGAGSPLTAGRVNYPGQTSQHENKVTVDVASSADRYKRKPARG
jgi:hypothetical protein